MAKHLFEWKDGRKFEFEDWDVDMRLNIWMSLPGRKPGSITQCKLCVKREDYETYRILRGANGYQTKEERAKLETANKEVIRVGVLANKSSNGMPAGIYLPYKIDNYHLAHLIDGLEGDFTFNERIQKENN